MSNTIDIKVPDIGDADEVEVIEVLVAENDTIEPEQSLITLESDKASMEIPAPQGGVVKAVVVKLGDKVSEGSVILQLEPAEADTTDAEADTTDAEADTTDADSGADAKADTTDAEASTDAEADTTDAQQAPSAEPAAVEQ